jgi:ABC-type antimicrobial peptide transport system permease subunit
MKGPTPHPPAWLIRILKSRLSEEASEEVIGDLQELFTDWYNRLGLSRAITFYLINVLGYLRPLPSSLRKKRITNYTAPPSPLIFTQMFKNYFVIAWRNLAKNKGYSTINILGLSAGMAVAILIGIWVFDELSFDKSFVNHEKIAKVQQNVSFTAEQTTYDVMPMPLARELRHKYADFEAVSLSVSRGFVINYNNENLSEQGNYVEPEFADIFSLDMIAGSRSGLQAINSVLISQTLADKLFSKENAINKVIKLNDKTDVKIAGVYKDMPANSSFKNCNILAPWSLLLLTDANSKNDVDIWDNNSYNIYVQLKNKVDLNGVTTRIQDIRMKMENPPRYKPQFFLHPMQKWHLYADFRNGKSVGGLIDHIWLFGTIGVFVLVLACINFMNLSTARSRKRAREVGIRKAVGSKRIQLIFQFLIESVLTASIAFLVSLVIAQFALPMFNNVSGKDTAIPWRNAWFWIVGIVFNLITGMLAGSYPALYLSSFKPVSVLKGTFNFGRNGQTPRSVLVVFQFTVSIILMIGTAIVFRQIAYSKQRPVGYSQDGLIEVSMNTKDLYGHYEALRNDLLASGGAAAVAQSFGSITVQYDGTTDFSWQKKRPDEQPLVMGNNITHDYGKTVGWELALGRDFSREFSTDTASVILNESAVKLTGFTNPLNEIIKVRGRSYKVIGVIKDMLKESPFMPVSPSYFVLNYDAVNTLNIRLTPLLDTKDALDRISVILKKYNRASPFIYKFVDEQFAKKFESEERIGKLSGFFTILAVFISCLGLLGMASYMAEQRQKEIGVRKVLGAGVFNLWLLLSKRFVFLVLIALLIAIPVSYYFMHNWLQNYEYSTKMSWWIFGTAGAVALFITIITVSFQAIKAGITNPIKSLRSE